MEENVILSCSIHSNFLDNKHKKWTMAWVSTFLNIMAPHDSGLKNIIQKTEEYESAQEYESQTVMTLVSS